MSKGLSQEVVGASQSYISDLERGIKSPTIEKLAELAANMGVHPLTILARAYLVVESTTTIETLLSNVRQELKGLGDIDPRN